MDKLFPNIASSIYVFGTVLGLFAVLNYSQKLHNATLDALTKPSSQIYWNRKFVIIRRLIIGKGIFNRRCLLTIAIIFFGVALFLFSQALILYNNVGNNQDENDIKLIQAFSYMYFLYALIAPKNFFALLVIAYVWSVICASLAEILFKYRFGFLRLRIIRYVAMLLLAFVSTVMLAGIFIWLGFPFKEDLSDCSEGDIKRTGHLFWRMFLYYTDKISYSNSVKATPRTCILTDDNGNNAEELTFFVIAGIMLMSTTVTFLSNLVIFLYQIGIVIAQIHSFVFHDFQLKQQFVYEYPVVYVGIFVAALCSATTFALGRIV